MGKNITVISICILIVIINNILGHYLAPIGLTATTIILPIIAALILFFCKNIHLTIKTCILCVLISLNDILLDMYAGGTHDPVGKAWQFLYLIIGIAPTWMILLVNTFTNKKYSLQDKIAGNILFLILIILHLYIFYLRHWY